MKKLIKGVLLIALAVLLLTACRPAKAQAATYRYTTQKVALRMHHKTVKFVKRNTRLRVVKSGKKWSKVRYKGKTYLARKKFLHKERSPKRYTAREFRQAGVIWWRKQKFTWYSERILPDPNNFLGIKGKHRDSQGFICDKQGYICLGSNTANRGMIVATPFGKYGKVYDAGYVGTYWFDCYVGW